jgi:hypothetical protein
MLRLLNGELKRILRRPIYKSFAINRLGIMNSDKIFYSKLSNSFCVGKEKKEVKENLEKNESDNTKEYNNSKENVEEKQNPKESKQEESEKQANQSEDAQKKKKANSNRDYRASLKKLLFGSGVVPSHAPKPRTPKQR